jgi:hypothetical protein
MSPLIWGLLVLASVFGAAMVAMRLAVILPKHHLSNETQDTVKLAMGLVATLTALVLGLLVSSAKGAYDTQKSEVTIMAAKIAFLDRVLAIYGPESASSRELIRQVVEQMNARLWPTSGAQGTLLAPDRASAERMFHAIGKLSPQNDDQRAVKAQAFSIASDLGQMRWLVFEQDGPSTSALMMSIVVCWIAILFFSFGLFAPSNGTVVIALLVAALSVAGSVFLILELDQPFGGLIQISNQPILNTLSHLGK